MGRRERMSSVDTAWLRMDSGGNLMVIVGVYELEGRLDAKRLRALLQDRFASHFRMRARVVQDATGYYWEEVDDFDIDRHLLRVALTGAGGIAELKQLTGRLASEPLAPDQPLWQFHLIDNYNGGQALIARIHHCIADGIALIGVLLAMTSDHAAPDPVVRSGKRARRLGVVGCLSEAIDAAHRQGDRHDRRRCKQSARRVRNGAERASNARHGRVRSDAHCRAGGQRCGRHRADGRRHTDQP
jgi:hypothetical protein